MKIALFGGTFNPIHLGHILIAENALKSVMLDKVFLIPCSIHPLKAQNELLEGRHRQTMIELAIKDRPHFEICGIEMEREGPSYTVDTVRHVRSQHPKDQIYLIIGSDNFQEIGHWNRFLELISLCEFLVIERPGYPLKVPPPSVPTHQLPLLRYTVFRGPTISVSSSDVRRFIREGKNVSHLVPKPVYDYIQIHHLYLP